LDLATDSSDPFGDSDMLTDQLPELFLEQEAQQRLHDYDLFPDLDF
jgi:hypothetical protein